MHSRKSCVANLLAGVKYADELARHLILHPFDFTVTTPLIKTAKDIRDCAQALRQKELWQLATQLIEAAQMDLTTPEAFEKLNNTITRINAIAETFGDVQAAKPQRDADTATTDKNDPFSSLTGTRWVEI